jgi:hypothetical protein
LRDRPASARWLASPHRAALDTRACPYSIGLVKGARLTGGKRMIMAADEAERALRSHQNTYHAFIGLMKYGAILSVITALVVIFIIGN